MGTRAVYTWKRPNYETYHIYHHWDGYPEGAAHLLDQCVNPEQFIRKNEKACLTVSPDRHGDLSYWYEISSTKYGKFISCWKRNELGQKDVVFEDKDYEEFIQSYLYPDQAEEKTSTIATNLLTGLQDCPNL